MSIIPLPIFKSGVPEWLIRITIFLVLLPALAIFALYFSNATETASYYGIEIVDVQYSVVLMYATLVSFLPLDDRLIKFLKPRQYLLIGVGINTLTYILCATIRSGTLFMICRFFQGMVLAMFCSICLNLIFPRLRSDRARVIGYSVFYGTLQISIPAGALLCSWVLHYFDFNVIFYFLIFLEAPGIILLLLITNNSRFRKKLPLYQTDWVSFIYYTVFFITLGYIFVYGQKLNWLDSSLIRILILICISCFAFFYLRQFSLKRPFVNLRILNYAHLRNGLLLLIAYYFFKGTTGFTYGYLEGVLNIDPISLTPLLLVNIAGIVIGMIVSSRFIFKGTPIKRILACGFSCFLVFHMLMYFLFSGAGETNHFIIPLFIQGLGTGSVFVPIVIFNISTVPTNMAGSVSFLGIASRFCGFCITIAVVNYYQLYNKSTHFNIFREQISSINPFTNETFSSYIEYFRMNGQDAMTAKELATHAFNKAVTEQAAIRASMDYYELMVQGLFALIVLIIIFPDAKRKFVKFSKTFLPY